MEIETERTKRMINPKMRTPLKNEKLHGARRRKRSKLMMSLKLRLDSLLSKSRRTKSSQSALLRMTRNLKKDLTHQLEERKLLCSKENLNLESKTKT